MQVLILHGWNLNAKYYLPLAKILQKHHFEVIVPDLPGFGQSQEPKIPYQLDNYVDFVVRILQSRKSDDRVIIGHSFGGRIAMRLAASHPQLVQKLILSGVPVYATKSKTIQEVYKLIAQFGSYVFTLPFLGKYSQHAQRLLYRISGSYDYYKTSGIMRSTFKNIIDEDLTVSMRKISQPTLLIWGEHDTITPVWIARKMQSKMHRADLIVLSGFGHSVIYKQPKLFVLKLLPFITT